MTDLEHEPDWSVTLRRQSASLSTGHAEGDTSTFEIICRECGDDPDLDYREVSPELRQIRGPYLLKAGIAAFLKHGEYHDRAEETGTHHARPDLAIPDQAPLSHTAARYSNLGRHRHTRQAALFDPGQGHAGSLHPGGQAEVCPEPSNQVSNDRQGQQWTPADADGRSLPGQA